MMSDILRQCRENFGPPPRRFSWYRRTTDLYVACPPWAWFGQDDLHVFFKHRDHLLTEGVIVWGHIVQANMLMFHREPGTTGGPDCPGEVVYCPDPDSDIGPEELGGIARPLFALKGTEQEDPELQFFSDYLANERVRVYGRPVPSSLSDGHSCLVSTVVFSRHHLPGQHLRRSYFPLLLSPGAPRVAMPLPSRYCSPSAGRTDKVTVG